MIFLLNKGNLPWSGFGKEFKCKDFEGYIQERLQV